MAITLYTGVMGSGKTYEVVAFVILPAILKGRNVVTNISGFNYDAAVSYLVKKEKVEASQIGSVKVVEDELVEDALFFPTLENKASIVQSGDLVVIDECWRFWGTDNSIKPEHMEFFRKHRHFINPETKISSDLVVISQDVSDLHRSLKKVIELSFRAKKLKVVGLSRSYVVEMWEGVNQRRKSVGSSRRIYKKDIFPLYNSYSGGNGASGVEVSVDNRFNILKSFRFLILIPICLCLIAFSFYHVWSFFKPKEEKKSSVVSVVNDVNDIKKVQNNSSVKSPVVVNRSVPPLSQEWRLSGFIETSTRKFIILSNREGKIRQVLSTGFSFVDGLPVAGLVDGERVTSYSGGSSLNMVPQVIKPVGGL